ncbi:MAG: hypothetical protein LKE41_05865 [Prevotella sp.]|nr:hypothetical protein [Prevotella sp.]MCI2081076.1 hypothetical protein [Prevotella sp.]MCI2101613.1 hypothetical protein [Prevotella sp.]
MVIVGCSTAKNTSQTRWWHALNANYNTYYNGSLAYIDGSLEKETGNKDNYTEIIPLYTVGNKNSKEIGKANFDRAILKCEKAIHQHSIKKRPVWDKKRRKTPKDIEWLNRREYNPFLWKAWLLMGRAQFHEGAFEDAASTFSYMSRLYATQPAIYGKARAWLAKSYIEGGWIYDAEDVIRDIQRDSLDWRAVKEWDYTYADYYIHTHEYDKAIPYLRKVIKHEMRRKQRAREWYLMGQLQQAVGNQAAAYQAFKKVIRQAPPHEIEFNARIAMTEVMAQGQTKKMIGKLKRMAASDNNKDYLDQVYYAMGNIYLNKKDTLKAIAAYQKGREKSTRNGIEKGVLLLKLGNLYWAREQFGDAQKCYGEAIGLLDKERPDYQQLSDRSKVLDELTPYTESIHLQDSLQALAKMNEKDRNAVIDKVIEELKKKEKEERNAQEMGNAQGSQAQNGNATGFPNMSSQHTATTQQGNAQWYFYNPIAVGQGKQTFQKLWGKRENADDWQRKNKTVVADLGSQQGQNAEQQDSLKQEEASQDSLAQITDSAQNDPHKREYYLAQIPFTAEQLQASNEKIEDGLFHAGVIFKDKLDRLDLSERSLRRLTDDYPQNPNQAEAYYHLFLLYSREGKETIANRYIERLRKEFPNSEWTGILTDPYFKENAVLGEHIEDSLYAATYQAFKANRLQEVKANAQLSVRRFSKGENRDKFIFIEGLAKLNEGDAQGCLQEMETLVEKYPESKMSKMAGMIINGVKKGRILRGGRFDMEDVWSRRSVVLNDSDSIQTRKFSNERDIPFSFIIAYAPDSVHENQLLFELAKYNFTSYLVRNFDIDIEDLDGLHRMQVKGFQNYDEAIQYARQLVQQKQISGLLGKSRMIVISEKNLAMIGNPFSYEDYDQFYAKHFAPLKVSTFKLLSEPAEIEYQKRPEKEVQPSPEEIENILDRGTYVQPAEQKQPEKSITDEDYHFEDEPQRQTTKSTTVKQDVPTQKGQVPQVTRKVSVPQASKKAEAKKVEDKKAEVKKKEKKEGNPIEDEYYELEGF